MTNKTPKRPRLTIDMTPELRRRIKAAALASEVSVARYVVDILETAVPTAPVQVAAAAPVTQAAIDRINQTRAEIMRGRQFTTDSAELLEEARQERLADL